MSKEIGFSPKHYVTFLLLFATAIATAQPGSGGDPLPCDPDATCPIDSWVFLLVACVVLVTTYYLYKNKKSLVA